MVFADRSPQLPTQRPPPPVPIGWRATWSVSHHEYYYWHPETNVTTWNLPGADTEGASAAVQAEREKVGQVCDLIGVDAGTSISLLKECMWNVEQAIYMHNRAEARRKELEEVARIEAARAEADRVEAARVEALRAAAFAAQAAAAREQAMKANRLAEQAEARAEWESHEQVQAADSCIADFVCIRKWSPKQETELKDVLAVEHGTRVRVTWVDQEAKGWAMAYSLEKPEKTGYVPKAVLRAAPTPRQWPKDSQCRVVESYQAPMAGYISVPAGELVKVLCPMECPFVWVYVESANGHGWVPESILAKI